VTVYIQVCRRALLKRVFSIYDEAWWQRLHGGPSDFQRMYSCLRGWVTYANEARAYRKEQQNKDIAVIFWRASLCAKVFYGWRDVARMFLRRRSAANAKYSCLRVNILKRVVTAWARYVFCRRLSQLTFMRDACRRRREHILRAVVLVWRNRALENKYLLHYLDRLMRERCMKRSFHCWLYAQYLRKMSAVVDAKHLLLSYKTAVKKVFFRWRYAFKICLRLKAGFTKLASVALRYKLRTALLIWPGRQSFAAAEEMRQRILRKGRGKARLVQCCVGRNCKPLDDHDDSDDDVDRLDTLSGTHDAILRNKIGRDGLVSIDKRGKLNLTKGTCRVSTVRRKASATDETETFATFIDFDNGRKSLHERVLAVSNDQEDHLHILSLMKAILSEWYRAVNRGFCLRKLSRMCSWESGKRMLARTLREWIALTPLTSHRVLGWMQKRYPIMSALSPMQVTHFIEGRKYNYSHYNDTALLLEDTVSKYVDEDGYDPFSMHFDVKKAKAVRMQETLEQLKRVQDSKQRGFQFARHDRSPSNVKWS
jgi:hypothetical protein